MSDAVDITTEDGVADAYMSRPNDGQRHPAVLFVMDGFGLRPQIEGMVDRIALLEVALTEVLEFQSAKDSPHIFDWGRWRRIRDNTPPFDRVKTPAPT